MRPGLLLLLLLLAGCSGAQLRTADAVYEGAHAVRMGIEAIPGVVPLADSILPWAPGVRLGLDAAYAVKHTLLPDNPLGLTLTAGIIPPQ